MTEFKDGKSNKAFCNLCEKDSGKSKVVVSRGNPFARFMLIGEAPGTKENILGKPFVGRSGKNLDNFLEDAGFSPSNDVFICNVVKCKPPKNRRPSKLELLASLPWLHQQICLVDPWVIALAGATALEALLGNKGAITDLRGKWQRWEGRLVMPLFHPAYLLRNPSNAPGSPKALTKLDFLEISNKLKSLEHEIVMPGFNT